MSYKIIILNEAKTDFRDALAYYRNIHPKLASRLLQSFKESVTVIKRNPLLFQIRYDDIRIKMITTFPYLIHYSISDDVIIIKLICHSSKNSDLNIF